MPTAMPRPPTSVRVYSASSGGSTLYDSGIVATATTYHWATWAGVLGTEYWWTIDVKDAIGEWQGESTRTAFKMRWAQAIYEFAVPGGATSSGWSFASGTKVETASFLFATATGAAGAGRSAWKTTVGGLTPAAYLNVMVRLTTDTAGTAASLADMTFSYIAAALTPDRWSTQAATPTDWSFDESSRRYGSRSYRCLISTSSGSRYIYPYTRLVADDIAVSPNTEYVFSAYVKTNAPTAADVSLTLFEAGTTNVVLTGLYLDADVTKFCTRDTSLHPEGWQRLTLHFRTAEQTRIRPVIHYGGGNLGTPVITIGDQFWVDAAMLEESRIASSWRPGLTGEAATFDATGAQIDETTGGIFRLRDAGGRSTALQSVVSAAVFTGVRVYKSSAITLATMSEWTRISNFTDTEPSVGQRPVESGWVPRWHVAVGAGHVRRHSLLADS